MSTVTTTTTTTTSENDMSNLVLETEEWIKITNSHVESISLLDIGKEVVQELENVTKSLVDLKESIDSKMNMLNQTLVNLESTTIQERKIQSICWAITNVQINQFHFFEFPLSDTKLSDVVVKQVLLGFRRNFGTYIPYTYYISSTGTSKTTNPTDIEKQAFRDALIKQVHELVGQKPQIVLREGDDRYLIHYPK